MSRILAAIIGGAAGALTLVAALIFLARLCICRGRGVSRNSESESSVQSLHGGNVEIELSFREARRFSVEELSVATRDFGEKSLVGVGKFGEVYKGLLQDGMLVAVKKRAGAPSQHFINKARYLSSVRYRNLVTLLGFCQENNMQFLVYEYISNGSVSSHLYGDGQASRDRLEFKHRLSIALGAAKGLAHLHSLSPRLVHKDFKTANVLVDENFVAKVADAGLPHFLGKADVGSSSSCNIEDGIFQAPEVRDMKRFSEKSDVYSFGVFLVELVSGREASGSSSSESPQNLVERVQKSEGTESITGMVDEKVWKSWNMEGVEELVRLAAECLEIRSERRPTMSYAVMELERILRREVNSTTLMGEGTPIVTLGSQLFSSTSTS